MDKKNAEKKLKNVKQITYHQCSALKYFEKPTDKTETYLVIDGCLDDKTRLDAERELDAVTILGLWDKVCNILLLPSCNCGEYGLIKIDMQLFYCGKCKKSVIFMPNTNMNPKADVCYLPDVQIQTDTDNANEISSYDKIQNIFDFLWDKEFPSIPENNKLSVINKNDVIETYIKKLDFCNKFRPNAINSSSIPNNDQIRITIANDKKQKILENIKNCEFALEIENVLRLKDPNFRLFF